MNTEVQRPVFKWEWNINTVAVLAGFIMGFVAWGYTLAELRTGREQNAQNIQTLGSDATALEARVVILERLTLEAKSVEFRLAQMEKIDENFDVRVNRITESYSSQFADIRTQLSSMATQIALVIQTTNRIEANVATGNSVARVPQPN